MERRQQWRCSFYSEKRFIITDRLRNSVLLGQLLKIMHRLGRYLMMLCATASLATAINHPAVMRPRHHQLTQVLEQSTSVTIVYYYERIEAHKFNPIFANAAQQMLDKYGNKLMFHQLDLAGAPIARRA